MADYDEDAARELELYVENDADLYRRQYKPILENLVKKKLAGKYDPSKAPKLFGYLMESGARKYSKEFGSEPEWARTFSPSTRRAVAERFAQGFEAEWDATKAGGGYMPIVCDLVKRSPTFRKRASAMNLKIEQCGLAPVLLKGGKRR